MMNYDALRAEQARAARKGHSSRHRLRDFIEVTNPSAAFYGVGGARITSQDGATVRLDATGAMFVRHRRHRAGPGRGGGGGAMRRHRLRRADRQRAGRSPATPTTRPMAAAPGRRAPPASAARRPGRPARPAGERARGGGLDPAGRSRERSTSATAWWSTPTPGRERIGLDEVARIAYFRPDTLPPGFQAELMATRHYVPRACRVRLHQRHPGL